MLLTCSGDEHISFTTSKIGSLVDVNQSRDPDGLRLAFFILQNCFRKFANFTKGRTRYWFFRLHWKPDAGYPTGCPLSPDVICHRISGKFWIFYFTFIKLFFNKKKRIFALSTKLYFFLSIKKTLNISCKFLVSCFKWPSCIFRIFAKLLLLVSKYNFSLSLY